MSEIKAEIESLGALDEACRKALVTHARQVVLSPGQHLFTAGDAYKQVLYLLLDGRLLLVRTDGSDSMAMVGEPVGLSNYLDGSVYGASAIAETTVTLLCLPQAEARRLEAAYPSFAALLDRALAARLRERAQSRAVLAGALASPVHMFMKSPLSVCGGELSIREAFLLMQARKIGSLGVLDHEGAMIGVLTYAGLVQALVARGASAEDSIMKAACESPRTIDQAAPLWQAEEALADFNLKYLIVLEAGRPVGVISQSDLVRAHVRGENSIARMIMQAGDIDALKGIYEHLDAQAAHEREGARLASTAVRRLSEHHIAIQRRCVELTLELMIQENRDDAPRNFEVLIMGSGGRQEMMLDPDQDNGLVIDDADGPLSEVELKWFEDFALKLNDKLAACGYILCPGEIMARNPMFRKTLSAWREQISTLVRKPNQKAARWSNIVFDFDVLYGEGRLSHALRSHLLAEIKAYPALLGYMVEDDAEGRPPLGWFNRLVTTHEGGASGTIDLKRNGLRLVADAARIYALSVGIAARGTRARLQALVRHGALAADLVDSVLAAFEEILDLLLQAQLRHGSGIKTIDPQALSSREHSMLRVAFRAIKRLQDQLQGQYGRAAF